MDLSLPCGGSARSSRRLLLECEARRGRGQALLAEGNGELWPHLQKITLEAYTASHPVAELKASKRLPRQVKARSSQYLNNWIEPDHRRVKQRLRPMLGLKKFRNAVVTISGVELAQKIKKCQFQTGKLGGTSDSLAELWNAALVA